MSDLNNLKELAQYHGECGTSMEMEPQDINNIIERLEAANELNKHLDLAVRKAEGCSEALRRRAEAAEKRVAELDRRNHVLREQRDGETIKRSDIEAQLAALAESHAQVIESRDLHKKVAATRAAPPSLPEGWVSCSPEWIERNGPCSCSEAPRIAFGNIGPHYHPAVYSAAPPAPIVGGRTMPRHEFAKMVNELRDVPGVQSKRAKIVSILHAFNINPAGGSVSDK